GGMKDQHLLIDALLVEICQPAVQIPSSADIDGGLMRSGCFALWRSQIEAGPAKLHEVSTVGEQRDLKGTAFQSFDDRDVTVHIDDLHRILLVSCVLWAITQRAPRGKEPQDVDVDEPFPIPRDGRGGQRAQAVVSSRRSMPSAWRVPRQIDSGHRTVGR